ncbi:MAG TPA: class I SAM-dependent methyltransferase [Thiopseudomonas sp.]|nr:class I SAM-dependent methyltransferase [Thiopseudomonas sp.]
MNYSEITINDPNPIKRFLQKSRFNKALRLYPSKHRSQKVLDFGGGDGELCLRLAGLDASSEYICYEPSIAMYQQAQSKISNREQISLIDSVKSIAENSIDVVYSLEVFEHLPEKELNDSLDSIFSILKPDGIFIVGVPNELFFAAIYKGLFRMVRRFGEFDATPGNILKCSLGQPPTARPIGEISPGMQYHFHHLGFDHRQLRKLLTQKFECQKIVFSPFRFLGLWGSPEIYYVLHKANNHVN